MIILLAIGSTILGKHIGEALHKLHSSCNRPDGTENINSSDIIDL